jgi:cytidylate kinase
VIGSVEARTDRVRKLLGLSRKAALQHVEREDRARRRYTRKYFKRDIEDPLLYDLVVNTGRLGIPEAARIVAEAVVARIG